MVGINVLSFSMIQLIRYALQVYKVIVTLQEQVVQSTSKMPNLSRVLVARDYIETTTAAVEGGITDNVPRLDYTDSSCPALLLEPQRTNVLTHSEYFGGWGQINTLNTANALISPEGVQKRKQIDCCFGSK